MPPTQNETTPTIHDQSKLQPHRVLPKKKTILLVALAILLLAIVCFVVVAFIAKDTTPDQKLYNFKTNIVEKVIRATKLSSDSELAYTSSLLEKRVAELLTLYSDTATSTPEVLDRLASLTQQHTGDSVWIIQNTNALTSEEKILGLAKISNTNRAFETLTDNWEEFESIKDYSGDIQNISQDGLKAAVEQFASTSDPINITTFIGQQISLVGEEIKTVAQGSRAQTLALARIDEAGEYITDTRFAEAIYALLRARQAIAVDTYLYASEREGAQGTEEEEPMPEGS
jgi:hypothetical protein